MSTPHPNRFPEAVLDCGLGGMGRAGVRLWNLVAQSPGTAKEQFWREVQKELSARETEASELVYFKLYKSEIPLSSTRSKAVLTSTNGYLLFPWTYAGMLKSSLANPATVAAALKDLNFWYVLAWLVPLGLCRLKTSAARMGYVIVHNGASRVGFHGKSQ